MKKIFITMILAIIAISIFSCKKVELSFSPISSSDGEVIFNATIGDNQKTKTTFNDQTLELFWRANDTVYFWYKEANEGNGAGYNYKAAFDGAETKLMPGSGDRLSYVQTITEHTFSAIYVGNNTSLEQTGETFTISLPATQTQSQENNTDHFGSLMAMKGFIIRNSNTTKAYYEWQDVNFSPLYSVLEFAFPYDANKIVTKVEAIITSDEGDQVLAFETANVSKNNNSLDITEPTTPSDKVTLNFDTPMDLRKGICKAWMIVNPGTYQSMNFTYFFASGEPITKEFNTPITIARGTRYCITTYGNIVHNTADENDNTINNIDAAIREQLGTGTITSLKVTGTMNQKDFETLKGMSNLTTLDLSEVTVVGEINVKYHGDNIYDVQDGNAIPYLAFYQNNILKSVLLPKSITYIGDFAFSYCSNLTGNLIIPEGVSTIGEFAFIRTNLTSFTIPSSVTKIDRYAFEGCTGLTGTLNIPSNVTTLGDNAFDGCTGLTGTLNIPSTLTTFGVSVFKNCSGFSTLSLNYSTTGLPIYRADMFPTQFVVLADPDHKPTGIVTVPTNTLGLYFAADLWKNLHFTTVVNNIANNSNNSVNNLHNNIDFATTSLKVTGTMNQADFENFILCRDLISLDLSEVTVVGDIKIKNDNTTQSGNAIPFEAFKAFNNLKTIILPKNITAIGDYAFSNCSGLNCNLTIPEGVTYIGEKAFYYCFLTGNLNIPSTVTTISQQAFNYCFGLKSISLNYRTAAELPTYNANIFPSIFDVTASNPRPVIVPLGKKYVYTESTEGWKNLNIPQVY